jgi:hypothetical protein
MNKKILSFIETEDPNILKDLDIFEKMDLKGSSEHVTVSVYEKGIIIKSELEEEIFFFGICGSTMDNIILALEDLRRNIKEEKEK